MIRIGLALSDKGHAKFVETTKLLDISQAALVESLLFGLSEEQLRGAVERGNELRQDDMKKAKAMRKQVRDALEDMTPEQLKVVLAIAEQNKAAGTKDGKDAD